MPGSILHTINRDPSIAICFLRFIIALVIIPDMERNTFHDCAIVFAYFLQNDRIFLVLYGYIDAGMAIIQGNCMFCSIQDISIRSCFFFDNVLTKFQLFAGCRSIAICSYGINYRIGSNQGCASGCLNILCSFDFKYRTGKFFIILTGFCDCDLTGFSGICRIQC